MQPARRHLIAIAAVALTTMMGVHALRGFLAMIVWNVAAERSATVLGGIAFAVYAAGLAGWIIAPRLDGPRAGTRRAIAFVAVFALSHYARHPLVTPALALIAATAWLWFFPALIGRLSRLALPEALAPGILTGFAAQVSLQTALHGVDLAMLRGILPGVGATGLAATLLLTWWSLAGSWREREEGSARPSPGWGLVAFGPYLMLQLALLGNVGRAQMLTGTALPVASLPALLGLAGGAVVLAVSSSPLLRVAAAVAFVLIVQPLWLGREGMLVLFLAHLAASITLAEALRPGAARATPGAYAAGAAGLLAAFVIMFLYYSRYEWPALWPVLAVLVAIPALLRRAPTRPPGSPVGAAAIVTVGLLGVAIGAVPPREAPQITTVPAQLRVLDYNIHMGFDAFGVPDLPGIAGVIEAADADVVALQEVGRGWTVNGGADLFAWLRRRFPEYRAVYGPMNGALWGNVLLSRYPISGWGSLRFPIRESRFQRGLTWVTLPASGGELLVIATHFAHEAGAETDRLGQAGDLLAFWKARPRTVVMGDLNAGPDSAPITRLLAAGLLDALDPHRLGSAPTYPSPRPAERLDYVLISPDVVSVSGSISRTTASDHLPVVVQIRMPQR